MRSYGTYKFQCRTVVAKAFFGWWWPIVEDMSLMSLATGAVVFGAWEE